jgi:hypothetical protein
MGPEEIIRELGLQAHAEGGHFAQTWCDAPADGSRGAGSAIYYLLRAGERSAWHRIDAVEVWHLYAGGSVLIRLARDGAAVIEHRLGMDLAAGERPQLAIPAGTWQTAEPLGEWALVGCTVAPAFLYSGWELAPPGWNPA